MCSITFVDYCSALRAHVIVVEVLYEINNYQMLYPVFISGHATPGGAAGKAAVGARGTHETGAGGRGSS